MTGLPSHPAPSHAARGSLATLALGLALLVSAPALTAQDGGSAFAWEAAGGVAGSMAGFGLGYLAVGDRCDSEDLSCVLESVGWVLVGSAAGSGLGAWWAGGRAGGEPSGWGAALGAAVGVVAGLGVVKLFDEAGSSDGVAPFVGFTVSQGLLTAVGAHLLGG